MEPTSSPTTIGMIEKLLLVFPSTRLHFYAPLARNAAWEGAAIALGRPLEAQMDLSKADVIVALDADLFGLGPTALRSSREFSRRRRVRTSTDTMNRLYVIESALTVTGGMSDHRLRVRRSDIAGVTAALLAAVAATMESAPAAISAHLQNLRNAAASHAAWIDTLARDLRAHQGKSLVVVGDTQPAPVHAMAHLINVALGNVSRTVRFTESAIHQAGQQSHGLDGLVAALDQKQVDTLLILGGNPVYSAPGNLDLQRRLAGAENSVYLGLYENETARACTWFIPAAHPLEAWGDARAYDGTISLVQPLVEPLHGGRTSDELIAAMIGVPRPKAHDLVREHWREQWRRSKPPEDFDQYWQSTLRAGVLEGTAFADVAVNADWANALRAAAALEKSSVGLEISFPADARVRDGAFTNNAWLLELPDPITKLTWENALLVSPKTAAALGIETEDVVELTLHGRRVHTPIFVAPGQAEDSVSLALGYGRDGGETLARGLGVNANLIRTAKAPHFAIGVSLRKSARNTRSRRLRRTGRWRGEIWFDAPASMCTGRTRGSLSVPRSRTLRSTSCHFSASSSGVWRST